MSHKHLIVNALAVAALFSAGDLSALPVLEAAVPALEAAVPAPSSGGCTTTRTASSMTYWTLTGTCTRTSVTYTTTCSNGSSSTNTSTSDSCVDLEG